MGVKINEHSMGLYTESSIGDGVVKRYYRIVNYLSLDLI